MGIRIFLCPQLQKLLQFDSNMLQSLLIYATSVLIYNSDENIILKHNLDPKYWSIYWLSFYPLPVSPEIKLLFGAGKDHTVSHSHHWCMWTGKGKEGVWLIQSVNSSVCTCPCLVSLWEKSHNQLWWKTDSRVQ